MEKATKAISDFMSRNGQRKTIVDQDYRQAITEEHVRPQQHEEVTTAVDKEIHQDHHQTIIQPIHASETLPQTHTHNAVAVEHKSFEHDNAKDTRAMLDEDIARYRDSSVTHDTTHTQSAVPLISGEHVHHHLHQHVQPVIHKETIVPKTVHTTIPVHEVHHAPTVKHETSTLPVKTWAEFEKEFGPGLQGKQTTTISEFDGDVDALRERQRQQGIVVGDTFGSSSGLNKSASGAAAVNGNAAAAGVGGTSSATAGGLKSDGLNSGGIRSDGLSSGGIRSDGPSSGGIRSDGLSSGGIRSGGIRSDGLDSPTEEGRGGSMIDAVNKAADDVAGKNAVGTTGASAGTSAGAVDEAAEGNYTTAADRAANKAYNESQTVPRTGAMTGRNLRNSQSATSGTSQGSKVSLRDKLNPFKDSDGDGKKGIMN